MTEREKIVKYLHIVAEEALARRGGMIGSCMASTLRAAAEQIDRGMHEKAADIELRERIVQAGPARPN